MNKKNPAADVAAGEDVKDTAPLNMSAADAVIEDAVLTIEHRDGGEDLVSLDIGGPPPPAAPVETGEVQTETRTVWARNKEVGLLTLEDGTPFPPNRKKWLTSGEAARFSARDVIVILN